jgi:hypothetical protein
MLSSGNFNRKHHRTASLREMQSNGNLGGMVAGGGAGGRFDGPRSPPSTSTDCVLLRRARAILEVAPATISLGANPQSDDDRVGSIADRLICLQIPLMYPANSSDKAHARRAMHVHSATTSETRSRTSANTSQRCAYVRRCYPFLSSRSPYDSNVKNQSA